MEERDKTKVQAIKMVPKIEQEKASWVQLTPEYGRLINKHLTVVISALLIIDDNCRGFYFIDPSHVAASSSLPCCTISVEL